MRLDKGEEKKKKKKERKRKKKSVDNKSHIKKVT